MSISLNAIDRNKAAAFIRGSMAAKQITQAELSVKLNINRSLLNGFLNRRHDLLIEQIELLFQELEIEHLGAQILTTCVEFQSQPPVCEAAADEQES